MSTINHSSATQVNLALATAAVMARDRHRLSRLKSGKQADAEKYAALLAKSNAEVEARRSRLPKIQLNLDLPVSQSADELTQAIIQHQVVIIAGETGSGKTTQLPKIAMLAGRGVTGIIGHTQPRRLAARSVSQRIAEELGEPLGQSVGFKVRFNETGDHNAIIRLMTDGILLAELGHDRFLTKYDTIIIDEAHERSLNIDFILGYLRQLLPKRPDLKVIITSATLDVERFSEYFNGAPIFQVEGRSFPVEVRYRPISELPVGGSDDDEFDNVEENLPRAVVSAVEECYQDADRKGQGQHADILIFASTEREIRELQDALQKHGPKHTEILPLYARLALAEQQRIFNPSGKGRRIIIATNVAETALTVPNIRYVIDAGFARMSRYSYRSRVQRLPIEAISQAAANQRKGRCGRIAAGVCIRLYSEEDFLGRSEFTEPEIRRTNLASVILQMENLRLGDIDQFAFIQPPDHRLVSDGRKLLVELGALQDGQAGLTKTGQQMAKMPIDPRLSRMILGGAHFGVLKEALIIVSALAVQDPRERPADKQTQADQKHALFKEPDSDFLFYLKLWDTLQAQRTDMTERQRREFARQHYLSWLRIREWRQTYQQLSDMAEQLKLSWNEQPATYPNLHQALLTGLLSFVAQKTDQRGEYLAVRQQKTKVFPSSILHKQPMPWVMAFEVVETSQVYMRTLAKIEPEWIIAAARGLLKYHYFEPHWSKKSGKVKAYAQISLFGLIIQSKQLIDYEQIDLVEAHEIFLRDALATGDLGIEPPFIKHNRLMIENVQRIEDKLRRRDLLVDEEALYQFYKARVPASVASRRAFEDWRGEIEKSNSQALFLTEADILNDDLPDTGDFPEIWQIDTLKLPTRYVFNPNGDDDGAVISVPVQALAQLDGKALAWGVAGWRAELVEALLKSLPKEHRRKLVPIPDTADKLLPKLNSAASASLLVQLVQALAGYGITEKDFQWAQVPPHLRPLVQVVDEKKRLIAEGRDLEELKARCRVRTSAPLQQHAGEYREFPPQFRFEIEKTVAGLAMRQFQALVALESPDAGVVVQSFSDEPTARLAHRQGVLKLFALQLGDLSRQLKKQLPKNLILTFSPLGDKAQLEALLAQASVDAAFTDTPYTAAEFTSQLQLDKPRFLLVGQIVLAELTEIFVQWQTIRRQMMGFDLDVFGESLHDIEDQLDALHLNDFVYRIDVQHWRQYPRYLKALAMRLERLPNNLTKDLQAVRQLDPHMTRLNGRENETVLAEYRWAVEELRISLFAQPMKTLGAVSAKRLEKLWSEVDA